MRTKLFLAALTLVGCNWMEFDDLSDATWVRSTDDANVGSRNYALAIVGLSTGASGGLLGVISDDTPDYSTIDYAADGVDKSGANDLKLGQHRIAALSDPPMFVSDGNGKFALAERSTTGGNIAVVFGSATAPAGVEFAAAATPDTVVFAGTQVVVSAGNTFYTLQMGSQVACTSPDATMGVAATASDGTSLWVWTKAGTLFSVPVSALAPCTGGALPAATSTFTTTGFMPANGARIHLVGNYAILAAHPPTSRSGQVFVVDTMTMTQVDGKPAEGLQTSTVATFGGQTYLALGIPDRAVKGVVAGQVDLLEFDAATGKFLASPALELSDAQPESGAQFGRSVTTMKFNDQEILVVAAESEVFAYYKTALYDALP